MKEINPYHQKIKITEIIGGFSTETKIVMRNGEQIRVLVKNFVNSEQKEFYLYIEQITSKFLAESYFIDGINNFLIIIHQDSTADIYINNVPIKIHIIGKKDIQLGEIVKSNDIADIIDLRFEGIEIVKEDNIIFCFKKGWKFGLYFDFRQVGGKNTMNIEDLYKELGRHYKYLAFQEEYSFLENESMFEQMFNDGWFPFIQLLGGDFKRLSLIYEHEEVYESLLDKFLNQFNRNRINAFIRNWWKNKIFNDKQSIINAGIEDYLNNTEAGYINCIKNLYSEIEGIIRISYFNENNRNPTFSDLKDYICQKAKTKFISEDTLGFPDIFYTYLDKVIFKGFDLKNGEVVLSRHTTSHGVAKPELYTKARALQAILILDQMYFYLT